MEDQSDLEDNTRLVPSDRLERLYKFTLRNFTDFGVAEEKAKEYAERSIDIARNQPREKDR
jgi:hypothetical protein